MTARPFLPDYFPGYDFYMWMDADSWAQTPEAIETMLAAAANDDAFYVAIEFDRDYPIIRQGRTLWQLHEKWYRSNFPAYLAEEMLLRPMLNCGIRAAAPGAPLWKKWAAVLTHTLQRIPEMKRENFYDQELLMNVAAYLDQAPFKTIPAEYNWMTLFSVPLWDATRKLYVRSSLPHTPISVLHLNHQGKLKDAEIPCADGSMLQCPLTFSAWLEAQGNG